MLSERVSLICYSFLPKAKDLLVNLHMTVKYCLYHIQILFVTYTIMLSTTCSEMLFMTVRVEKQIEIKFKVSKKKRFRIKKIKYKTE